MNLVEFLQKSSNKFASNVAVIDNGVKVDYSDFWKIVTKLSIAFHKIGIGSKQRVALILPNGIDFIFCFLALLKVNAIVCPIKPNLTVYEIESIFRTLRPHAIISIDNQIYQLVKGNRHLVQDKTIIVQDESRGKLSKIVTQYGVPHIYKLKDLYNNVDSSEQREFINVDTDQIATINYTYRGTGIPLGAMLTHKNYVDGILAHIARKKTNSQHKVLIILALSHTYSLVDCLLGPLMSGATLVISKNYLPNYILKIIEGYRINHLTAVPSLYRLLLRYFNIRKYDLSSLTCCITGGDYMSVELHENIEKVMGITVLQGYGLTETLPVTWNSYDDAKPGTLGMPFKPNFQIKIVGDDGNFLELGQPGEIVINSPTVMQGYVNQIEETNDCLKNGWFYTGDYGYIDRHGYLYFLGLKKKIAKVGGNMVDLTEVRNVIESHPFIEFAHVYSKQDELWGRIIAADVIPMNDKRVTECELINFCSQKLARYKVPRFIEFKT